MNIQDRRLIRPATTDDATALARLIDIAGEGIPTWLWTKSCLKGQTPLDIGTERARRATGGFSYTNALIAEDDGAPLGMVLSYAITKAPTENPDDLPAPIAPFVALEQHSVGTWYINALAVFEDHRDKGIGARLLKAAEDLAALNGFDIISIQVYGQNTRAVRLYQSLGYEKVAQEAVKHHPAPPYYTGDVLLLVKRLVDE